MGQRFESDAAMISSFLHKLVQGLRADTVALVDAEERYVAEAADDPPARAARDEANELLVLSLGQCQRLVKLTCEEGAMMRYGLDFPLSTTSPHALLVRAKSTYKLLMDNPRALKLEALGVESSTKKLAEDLAPKIDRLEATLQKVSDEQRELTEALFKRNEAFERWREAYVHVSSILSHCFVLAGFPEHAKRLRPSVRKSIRQGGGRQRHVEPTPEAPETPEA